jgi:peptidoglycan/LPS O-acetylase OafA/YrhL
VPPPDAPPRRLADLDGLRAVAALTVMLSHV